MSFFDKFKMAKAGDEKARERALNELVNQKGYPRGVVEQTLKECKSDIDKTRERLLKKYGEPQLLNSASALPAYSNEPPPPYTEVVDTKQPTLPLYVSQDTKYLLKDLETSFPKQEERCCSCFDPIRPDDEEGFTGESVWQGQKAYHTECYLKNRGPRCEFCCFALIAFPDKGLSGRWGIYSGQKYHEECYTNYAGPRCSSCCDVIAPNSDEGFSGVCHEDGNKLYHVECFTKKNLVEYKAKYS